jgi:hypothetical protein
VTNGTPPLDENDSELEPYPVEPHYHPVHRITRIIYDFLASARLAMFLLVVILACCVVGVTIFRQQKAAELIFGTLWFNALLVALVINVACCFFGRIWGRRVTLVSLGMILFHLSFVSLFGGIIYNSLYYFRGIIRLTEGETLSNGDPQSYDLKDRGRFFNYSRLKGTTTLNRLHVGYKSEGKEKRVAYEITVENGVSRKNGIIYLTQNLDFNGFRYFPDREGYSLLTLVFDRTGKELFGAYVPLQSFKQQDNSYVYASGTMNGLGSFPFPQAPRDPLFELQITYRPDQKTARAGEVNFQVLPVATTGTKKIEKPLAEGKVAIGSRFDTGDYYLSAGEVRYWAAMKVAYEPGQPVVLTSLWVGLFGVTLTTLARIFRKRRVASSGVI